MALGTNRSMSYDSISMDLLGRQLFLTFRVHRDRLDAAMRTVGASMPQWIVLKTIGDEPDLAQRQLAERMRTAGSTLTHHLDRLEQHGYLVRRRDGTDRRVIRVALTPAGAARRAELDLIAQAHSTALEGLLGERDAKQLRRLLTRLRDALEAPTTEDAR